MDISNAIEAYQSNEYIIFAKRERCGEERRGPMADRKFKGVRNRFCVFLFHTGVVLQMPRVCHFLLPHFHVNPTADVKL